MDGGGGRDQLAAALGPRRRRPRRAASGSRWTSTDRRSRRCCTTRTGWIDFGPAGARTTTPERGWRSAGTLTLDGATARGDRQAWFDHQWGDFISVGGGGWDWFAVNLADGTDLTLSLVRDRGRHATPWSTERSSTRPARRPHLAADAFTVDVDRTLDEPEDRRRPTRRAGTIHVPSQSLAIDLTPTVADQELDTRPSTGVVYWEGSQKVTATRSGQPLAGEAYVELTGYATAKP